MYGIMCGLHAYKTRKYKSTVATDFHDCWPLPEDSSVNPLVYLCVAKTFIDTWINTLGENIAQRCLVYKDKITETFQKYPTEVKKPSSKYFRIKRQGQLTDIGGTWFLNYMNNPKPPIN